jgi:hypothetical protein
MRELGVAAQADPAQFAPGLNQLPGCDADRTKPHMTILGLPAVAVIQHNAIAAFHFINIGCASATLCDVRQTVAHSRHTSGRCGQNGDPVTVYLVEIDKPEIRALVAIIRHRTTGKIPRSGRWIVIDILLYKAILPKRALDRLVKGRRPGP